MDDMITYIKFYFRNFKIKEKALKYTHVTVLHINCSTYKKEFVISILNEAIMIDSKYYSSYNKDNYKATFNTYMVNDFNDVVVEVRKRNVEVLLCD